MILTSRMVIIYIFFKWSFCFLSSMTKEKKNLHHILRISLYIYKAKINISFVFSFLPPFIRLFFIPISRSWHPLHLPHVRLLFSITSVLLSSPGKLSGRWNGGWRGRRGRGGGKAEGSERERIGRVRNVTWRQKERNWKRREEERKIVRSQQRIKIVEGEGKWSRDVREKWREE